MPRFLSIAFSLIFCLAAPTGALALTDTEVFIDGLVSSQIDGLAFDPGGTYSKPGFPLLLPQTNFVDTNVRHDNGDFTFSSDADPTGITYRDWVYELEELFGGVSVDDAPLGASDPFSFANIDLVAGTADLLFTAEGAMDWNMLATGSTSGPFSEDQLFGTTTFVPEPSTGALMALGLVGLATRRRRLGTGRA